MRTPQGMLDARRDDPTVRGIDWELEGTIAVGEQIYALEGVTPSEEHFRSLLELLNDEVDRGLWPVEDPDVEGRQRAGVEATILLDEGGEEPPRTVH